MTMTPKACRTQSWPGTTPSPPARAATAPLHSLVSARSGQRSGDDVPRARLGPRRVVCANAPGNQGLRLRRNPSVRIRRSPGWTVIDDDDSVCKALTRMLSASPRSHPPPPAPIVSGWREPYHHTPPQPVSAHGLQGVIEAVVVFWSPCAGASCQRIPLGAIAPRTLR